MKGSPFLILTMIILSDEINGFIFQMILDYVRHLWYCARLTRSSEKTALIQFLFQHLEAWFKSRPIIYERCPSDFYFKLYFESNLDYLFK